MAGKETVFKLGGKEYTLKFTMRVPLYWEGATGKNYFAKPSLTDILTLVWAVFKNGGCKLTLEELADKLTDGDLKELSGTVLKLAENNTSAADGGTQAPLDSRPRS